MSNRTVTESCLIDGMPDDVYHADPVKPEPSLSAGMGADLTQSTPLHCWTKSPRLNPDAEREDKAAFDLGSAFHTRMLGVGGPVHVIDADSYRTKAAQKERDDAYAAGMTPLLVEQNERVIAMVRAARLQMRAAGLGDITEMGRNEVSMFWRGDGVWKRCRADSLLEGERIVYDLKTSGELADPNMWCRRAFQHGVDLRAAHYLDGLNTLMPGKPWSYRFIVVETKPPHGLSIVQLDETALEIGARKMRAAAEIFRECLDADRWPCWPAAIATVQTPGWEAERWFEREARVEDMRRQNPTRQQIDLMIAFDRPETGGRL